MRISEIFHSIQGEGTLTGVPSIFIRTSGCNLRCNWCDTPYASWYPEGKEYSIDEIVSEINAIDCRHIVITGGEPMIAKEIDELTQQLHKRGYHITIETAGTVAPRTIVCDLASISPKLSNSTPDDRLPPDWKQRHNFRRLQPKVLREWIDRYPYQLKFVVSNPTDLKEIDDLLLQIGRPIPPDHILLMPEGTDTTTLKERQEWLLSICLKRGFRYCSRLHIQLFGNRRGT